MPDNQHRKLYSKTYYSQQANLHYAECSRACAERMSFVSVPSARGAKYIQKKSEWITTRFRSSGRT